MGKFLDWILGGDDTSAEERILEQSAGGSPLVVRAPGAPAAPVVGRTVQNDSAEDFLRATDFFRAKRGLSDPYARSGWVQQAIKLVTNPILAVPLRFSALSAKGVQTVIQDPALTAFWKTPAKGPAGLLPLPAVLSATVGWLKLKGEAFWVGDDSWLALRGGPRSPFWIARPDQMQEVVGKPTDEFPEGQLVGWLYTDRLGKRWPLAAEQVFHPHFFNPYNPFRGLAEYVAAAIAAEGDIAAANFGKNLMESNGDRGPIISIQGTEKLSEPQRAQMEARIKAKLASVRAGSTPPEPLILAGDVKVANPAVQSADSDFVAMRVENRKEIYMILGVPSSFAEQMHHATTAHESDRYILIEQTCLPLAALIAGTVEQMSRNMKGLQGDKAAALTAFFDWDEHSIFLQVRAERVDTWKDLVGAGMPPALAAQYLGMRLPTWEGDDVSLVPLAIQTLEEVLAGPEEKPAANAPTLPASPEGDNAQEPDETDPDADEEKAAARLADRRRAGRGILEILTAHPPTSTPGGAFLALTAPTSTPAAPPAVDPAAPAPTAATIARAATEESRAKLAKQHSKLRRPAEKMLFGVVKKALFNAQGQMQRRLENTTLRAAGATVQKDDDKEPDGTPRPHPGTALDVMFDPATFALEMVNGVEKVGRTTMQEAGTGVRAELGVEDPWTMESAEVYQALNSRANLIRNSSQEIFDNVREQMEEGFRAGESTEQLATRIRSVFSEIRAGRAKAIAITETGAAYGAGREQGARSVGYKTKSWLSARDTHVRPTHQEADGQKVSAGGDFTVGKGAGPYPCAPGLPVEECVNCRCTVLFHT